MLVRQQSQAASTASLSSPSIDAFLPPYTYFFPKSFPFCLVISASHLSLLALWGRSLNSQEYKTFCNSNYAKCQAETDLLS